MKRLVAILAAIALAAAVVRFFLKGLLAPIGVPTVIGTFLASITIVLLVGTVLIFRREARDSDGRFIRGAGWTVLLSAWCQALIIGGILLTEAFHADTYYNGPWAMVQERFPTVTAHVIGHTQGFFFLTAILLIIGGIVYAIVRRKRIVAV